MADVKARCREKEVPHDVTEAEELLKKHSMEPERKDRDDRGRAAKPVLGWDYFLYGTATFTLQ